MILEWVIVTNLGSTMLLGVGVLFMVLWWIGRSAIGYPAGRQRAALLCGIAIFGYAVASAVLSLSLSVAQGSMIQGVLFAIASVLLTQGFLGRVGQGLTIGPTVAAVALVGTGTCFFAYVQPHLAGRVLIQYATVAVLLVHTAVRLRAQVRQRWTDRLVIGAVCVLTASAAVTVALCFTSAAPREIRSVADLQAFLDSALGWSLALGGTVAFPAVMIAVLAASVGDTVLDLGAQRDHDDLTGLLNRRGFHRRAERALRRSSRCFVVVADLDHFKAINDEFGHAAGDEVIRVVARILAEVPGEPRIVGRLGGEEFAVVLPESSVRQGEQWTERARTRIASQLIPFQDHVLRVTASFGMADGARGASLADLLGTADKALYLAKLSGRNRTQRASGYLD